MGSPGGITTRHEFAELACTDRHRKAGSRLRALVITRCPGLPALRGATEVCACTESNQWQRFFSEERGGPQLYHPGGACYDRGDLDEAQI